VVASVGSDVRFSVTYTGVCIPGDHFEAIFERFWQAIKATGEGSGCSFLSKCIVEAHGGRIWAESDIRLGSTFCFTLPGHDQGARDAQRRTAG
jgi:signal transduction histidine kinase